MNTTSSSASSNTTSDMWDMPGYANEQRHGPRQASSSHQLGALNPEAMVQQRRIHRRTSYNRTRSGCARASRTKVNSHDSAPPAQSGRHSAAGRRRCCGAGNNGHCGHPATRSPPPIFFFFSCLARLVLLIEFTHTQASTEASRWTRESSTSASRAISASGPTSGHRPGGPAGPPARRRRRTGTGTRARFTRPSRRSKCAWR